MNDFADNNIQSMQIIICK